ncbi:MAG: glycoside hydrolase family 105 protein [Granulosicoccus sp.]
MLIDYFKNYVQTYSPYKNGAWCYEDGCIYRGLELLHRSSGEAFWLDSLIRLVDTQLSRDGTLKGYKLKDYNIDNILPGRALLYLYEITGQPEYLSGATTLVNQLESHPRTNSNVYWHKLHYPSQIWLDGLYMAAPFQIKYGLLHQKPKLVQDSLQQLIDALRLTYVSTSGLYAHAYDEARVQDWADRETGHTRAHWARSLGWLSMALVDIAELVDQKAFEPLLTTTTELLDDIASLKTQNGLWLQVIDQPELAGNYEESSASAMFTYSLLKAHDLRLWQGSVDGLFDNLVSNVIRMHEGKPHSMINICHVAGLGMYEGRYRDGSAQYYLSEALVDNDSKGVGPLMMALATSQR